MTDQSIQTVIGLIGPLGLPELLIIAFIGLLIFGKRLPEVGKSLGKGIVSFKKGLQGVESDIDEAVSRPETKSEPAKLEGTAAGNTEVASKQKSTSDTSAS